MGPSTHRSPITPADDEGWFEVPDPDARVVPSDRPRGDTFLKWSTAVAGFTLVGAWQGTRIGTYGPLGSVRTEAGDLVTFPLPTMLERRVSSLAPEQLIRLTYLGSRPSKKREGARYHDFLVESKTPIAATADDGEVPF